MNTTVAVEKTGAKLYLEITMTYRTLYFCIAAIITGIVCIAFRGWHPETHRATFYTALGTYTGEAKLDLHAPNGGMIEIVTNNSKKNKESISVNSMLVRRVVIDTVTYYMGSLENSRQNVWDNCLVTRITGTDTLGVFMFTDNNNKPYYFFRTSKERNYLNIMHDRFTGTLSMLSHRRFFQGCDSLVARFRRIDPAYDPKTYATEEEKLKYWIRLVDEYYACL